MPIKNLKQTIPVTAAIRVLKAAKAEYVEHVYVWEEHGGTEQIARELGVDEHAVIKTIILETEARKPFVVLMHGDKSISLKEMARFLGVKRVEVCTPEQADKNSGYHVGGTSPFGTKKAMPVYCEATILELPKLYINGGYRGYALEMTADTLKRILSPTPVNVAIQPLD